jgi:TatD DNase family protein
MFVDAHCHPFDLSLIFPDFEQERRRLGVIAAASACDLKDFTHNEELAQKAAEAGAAPLLPCFGIHPQQPAVNNDQKTDYDKLLEAIDRLAAEKRIAAVGECGFDLYNAAFRETETLQDRLFALCMETALRFDLPLVLHVRRAMHKIFAAVKTLAKCRAVIFHSWPGTFEEGQSLLRRGVNVFFSFGNTIALNHKQAIRSCAMMPSERLLTETDAPFQPRRGQNYSQWTDLPFIIQTIAHLRSEAGSNSGEKELESQIEVNFRNAFLN